MAWAVTTPMTMVWPSVDLAVMSTASVLETPGRFSTITGCLSSGPSLSATARAMASVPPPGADPTSMRTGLTGQFAESWAWACQGSTAAPHTAAMESR